MDMYVCMRSALHSKSLGWCCQKSSICMFLGGYYTRCALIRTDGLHYICSWDRNNVSILRKDYCMYM